jgi:hypothetical protein
MSFNEEDAVKFAELHKLAQDNPVVRLYLLQWLEQIRREEEFQKDIEAVSIKKD